MDQRANDLRQDIASRRTALDEKLDTLERKAGQLFDLRYQAAEHPWLALGGAVTAGYVLGILEDEPGDSQQRGERAVAHLEDEITIIKAAAVSTLIGFLHDSIRAYVPALGEQLDQVSRERRRTPAAPPSSMARSFGTSATTTGV